MKRNEPPMLATWLLEHLEPEARDYEPRRSLAIEFYSGRSRAWYWRRVISILIAAWISWLKRNAVLLSVLSIWLLLVPAWTTLLDRTENNAQVLGRTWRMDWPFSSSSAFSVWLASSFIYLVVGLLLYGAIRTKCQWKANLKLVLRSFMFRVPLILPLYFITFVGFNLLSYPGPEADRNTISPLSAVTDVRLWAIAIRIPYFFTMVCALRKTTADTSSISSDSDGSLPVLTVPSLGRTSDTSTVMRGLTLLSGSALFSSMLVAFLFCRLPDSYSPTVLSLVLHASAYVMFGALAGIAAMWFYWNSPSSPFRLNSPVPLPLLSAVSAAGWVWVPAMVILYDQISRAAAIVAMIGAFLLGAGLRRTTALLTLTGTSAYSGPERSEIFAESLYLPPVEPSGYLVAAGLSAGAYLLIEKSIFAATALLAFTSFLFAWVRTHVQDREFQVEREFQRATLRLLSILLPAIIATAWALLDGIEYRNHAAEMAASAATRTEGGHGSAETSKDSRPKSGVGGYESIILWPILRKKELIAPIPPKPSPFAYGSSQPLAIPFIGSYWYFQPPEKRPGPDAHQAYGSPAGIGIRSENSIGLAVEAHQRLPYEIRFSQCREIEVDVTIRDTDPGEVTMAVLLSDSHHPKLPAVPLGRQLVISNDVGHPIRRPSSSFKSFRYSIPEHPSSRQFDEITVELIPDLEHSLTAPRLAIEKFRLFPM